jgi:predicted negative regulator of RcsB-dependent stress response
VIKKEVKNMKKLLQILGGIFLVIIVIGVILGVIFVRGLKEYKEAEAYCSKETKKLFNQFLNQVPKGKDGTIYMKDFGDFSKVEDFMINAYTKCMKEKGVPDSMINIKKEFK